MVVKPGRSIGEPLGVRRHGLRFNRSQFMLLSLQVFLVGMTLGLMRTVVPALAEREFGVPRGSFLLLVTFVVAFGAVKAVMNLVAGRLAERAGRRRVLLAGWLVAWPIPLLIHQAPSWSWLVVATVLLGVQQGLCWSMTQTAQLDLGCPAERGRVIGLNELAGYGGVAIAGVVTGLLAQVLGPRLGLLRFGTLVIGLATLLAWLVVAETLPWARQEHVARGAGWSTRRVFIHTSWSDRRLAALCQAGLVEKFVDALAWVVWPVWLLQRGVDLPTIGGICGVYGFAWGSAQLLTGALSDRWGRQALNVGGMWTCAAGVALMPLGITVTWWSLSAGLTGLGMAMLYPNLSAAVVDLSEAKWRASAVGVYRFWRDLGYAVGALGLGMAAALGGGLQVAFGFVAVAMLISGGVLLRWGTETCLAAGLAGSTTDDASP
ncbi:MAG: hypothetical protein RIQ60_1145 [Pseudomonadota bacterium]|jgi:MFS family permease